MEHLVPTGLRGHGWEPNASITRDIIGADAFVHVGPGFQPWADRAIQTLRDDGADTQLINVREGVELVDLAATRDPEEEGVGEPADECDDGDRIGYVAQHVSTSEEMPITVREVVQLGRFPRISSSTSRSTRRPPRSPACPSAGTTA